MRGGEKKTMGKQKKSKKSAKIEKICIERDVLENGLVKKNQKPLRGCKKMFHAHIYPGGKCQGSNIPRSSTIGTRGDTLL